MQIPVVTILRGENPVRINLSDYTADMGEIIDSDPALTAEQIAALTNPPGQILSAYGAGADVAAYSGGGGGKSQTAPVVPPVADAGQTAPVVPPVALAVVKRGKPARWFVTDSTGVDVVDSAFDPQGYAKESDAWDVILGKGKNA